MEHHVLKHRKDVEVDKRPRRNEFHNATQHIPKTEKSIMEEKSHIDTFGMSDTLSQGEYDKLVKKQVQGAAQFHHIPDSDFNDVVSSATNTGTGDTASDSGK